MTITKTNVTKDREACLALNPWRWRVVLPSRCFPELAYLNDPIVMTGIAESYVKACSAVNLIRFAQYATRISIWWGGNKWLD